MSTLLINAIKKGFTQAYDSLTDKYKVDIGDNAEIGINPEQNTVKLDVNFNQVDIMDDPNRIVGKVDFLNPLPAGGNMIGAVSVNNQTDIFKLIDEIVSFEGTNLDEPQSKFFTPTRLAGHLEFFTNDSEKDIIVEFMNYSSTTSITLKPNESISDMYIAYPKAISVVTADGIFNNDLSFRCLFQVSTRLMGV